jgi:alanyl-tRNA synthetase
MVINRKRIEDETRALLDEKPYQIAKYKNLGSKDMNFALKLISDKKDVVVVLYSESEKKIMMSHDGKKTVQCNELFKSIRDYNGKGGGSAKSAQGIFDDNESGYAFLSYVQESLEKIYG